MKNFLSPALVIATAPVIVIASSMNNAAQANTVSFAARIIDSNGAPVENADITITFTSPNNILTTRTIKLKTGEVKTLKLNQRGWFWQSLEDNTYVSQLPDELGNVAIAQFDDRNAVGAGQLYNLVDITIEETATTVRTTRRWGLTPGLSLKTFTAALNLSDGLNNFLTTLLTAGHHRNVVTSDQVYDARGSLVIQVQNKPPQNQPDGSSSGSFLLPEDTVNPLSQETNNPAYVLSPEVENSVTDDSFTTQNQQAPDSGFAQVDPDLDGDENTSVIHQLRLDHLSPGRGSDPGGESDSGSY